MWTAHKWVETGFAWADYAWWGRACICHCLRWMESHPKNHQYCQHNHSPCYHCYQLDSSFIRRSWCLPKPLWAAARPMDGREPFYDDHHLIIIVYDDHHMLMMMIRWVWTSTTGTWSASPSSLTTSPSSPPAMSSPVYFAKRSCFSSFSFHCFHFHGQAQHSPLGSFFVEHQPHYVDHNCLPAKVLWKGIYLFYVHFPSFSFHF